MDNRIIDFKNKKKIVKIETEEKINELQLILKITFDDNETLIMDLDLLGEINKIVEKELEKVQKRVTERLGVGLGVLATLMFSSGSKKEFEKFIKDIVK